MGLPHVRQFGTGAGTRQCISAASGGYNPAAGRVT